MATKRCWMVDRTYNDKGMVVVTYATTDGQWYRERRMAAALGGETTAAIDVPGDRLGPVKDLDRQTRYATEATRMAERHDPDDRV